MTINQKIHLDFNSYCLDWSNSLDNRIAISSFQSKDNKIVVYDIDLEQENNPQVPVEIHQLYSPTNILFEPKSTHPTHEWLASSTDVLNLYKIPTSLEPIEHLTSYQLINTRNLELAPLTSFDWSECDSNLIVTSSIDTTCTIWDLELQKIKTQLIAHDSEVFDVQFASNNSKEVFGSVGADGSVRLFDLRCLDQSTIIYETTSSKSSSSNIVSCSHSNSSILKLKFNRMDPNYLSIIEKENNKVGILDLRKPFIKVAELCEMKLPPITMDWLPKNRNEMLVSGK
ncbi:WD40 repeat-like protein [Neoconidiobolus thromboides FSU 785]|nr:WD40 repeat-like protein [Neoconidiobolus thromboides FSU 785]